MKRLLMAWSARLPCRLIKDGDTPYLERYYVGSPFGLRIYLHRFVASDPDRGMHDHPWQWALSIILSGWYYEERRDTLPGRPRMVRRLNWLRGDTFHRVLLPRDQAAITAWGRPAEPTDDFGIDSERLPAECWSLFLHRVGHAKQWGFFRPLDVGDGKGGSRKGALWAPVTYPGGGSQSGEWWRTAPTGKAVREDAAAAAAANIYPVDSRK